MLWTQYSLEQLQIWFHRCLLFYVQIYFTGVKWTAVSTNKTTLNEAFLQEKALLPTPTELCDEKFSIEAGEKKISKANLRFLAGLPLPLCAVGLNGKRVALQETWWKKHLEHTNRGRFLHFNLCVSVSR